MLGVKATARSIFDQTKRARSGEYLQSDEFYKNQQGIFCVPFKNYSSSPLLFEKTTPNGNFPRNEVLTDENYNVFSFL